MIRRAGPRTRKRRSLGLKGARRGASPRRAPCRGRRRSPRAGIRAAARPATAGPVATGAQRPSAPPPPESRVTETGLGWRQPGRTGSRRPRPAAIAAGPPGGTMAGPCTATLRAALARSAPSPPSTQAVTARVTQLRHRGTRLRPDRRRRSGHGPHEGTRTRRTGSAGSLEPRLNRRQGRGPRSPGWVEGGGWRGFGGGERREGGYPSRREAGRRSRAWAVPRPRYARFVSSFLQPL